MKVEANTIEEYFAALPPERADTLRQVRDVILKNLPEGYEEGMQYNMIGYYVPHSLFPAGYHCDPRQPLNFMALGNQKNHMALYMMCLYGDPVMMAKFQDDVKASGKKLDMGKACLRFKKLDDLALDVLGELIAKVTPEAYVSGYLALLAKQKK